MATCARVTARSAQHLPLLSSPRTPSHSGFSPIPLLFFFPFPSPSSLLSSLHQRPPSPPPSVTAASSFPFVFDRCPDHHLNALVDSFLSDDRVYPSPTLFFCWVHRASLPRCPFFPLPIIRCQHHLRRREPPSPPSPPFSFPSPSAPLLSPRSLPLSPPQPSTTRLAYLLSSPTTLFEPGVDPPPFPYCAVHRRCYHRLPLHPCQCHG